MPMSPLNSIELFSQKTSSARGASVPLHRGRKTSTQNKIQRPRRTGPRIGRMGIFIFKRSTALRPTRRAAPFGAATDAPRRFEVRFSF